ncbi:DUF1294 domain-containing protein [Enterococcus olivae]
MTEFLRNPLWSYLIIVNVYVFFLMGYDKRQAIKKKWRVPEANLIFMGLVGGGLGGLIARRVFHHKTRKKKFLIGFLLGVLFDLVLIFVYR